MSVSTVKERILDILDSHASINFVGRGTVRNISQVPAFLVFAERATHDKGKGNDLKTTIRNYRIIGLIELMTKLSETEAEQAVEPFYDIIEGLFDIRPGLWLSDNTTSLAGVQNAELIDDTGFIHTGLAGKEYAACHWILQVEEIKNITQGA